MTFPESALSTIQPELMTVTRLFGIPDSAWSPPQFRFIVSETPSEYQITFTKDGDSLTRTTPIPSDPDPRLQTLHRKRALRRLCKQTLYDFCRRLSGIHPPWGSMTGVRPTHLMQEALAAGLSPSEAVDHLISVFDVTRPKAELLREIAEVQASLPPPGDAFVDVYVGIPFCTTRCAYCSFSSGELGNGSLVAPYLSALFRELTAVSALLRDAGKTLRALYIGGGTPTSLPEADFARFLDHTLRCFPSPPEITVEAGRPDTLSVAKLRAIRACGVSRISINPQTMNDRTLRVIGRAHTAAQVREAYALARREGFTNINMDVIAGLPGETEADFAHTMEEAVSLAPESLTVHTLAIKRSSRMSLENAPLPPAELTAAMVNLGHETARRLGMQPYYLYRQKYMAGDLENTGYALPGCACLYNVDIMEETTHILALGAGGISKRIWPEEGHITRAPNVSNIHDYITRVDEMIARKRSLFQPE